jgi:proteasome assembly chaperone (PAC2) family protein
VYGQNPLSLLDLIPLPISQYFNGDSEERAKQLEQVCDKIERKNQKYQTQDNKHYKYIKFK